MNLDNKITLDIESLPSQSTALLAAIRAEIQPPGQYKKPESIAAWMAENADAMALEQFNRTALDGLYGRVCVVGFAVGDRPVAQASLTDGATESDVIRTAFGMIEAASVRAVSGRSEPLVVVGHNVQDFDLRFLFQRATRHGIAVPVCISSAFDPDRQRESVIDTMKLWGGYKRDSMVGLKTLAKELLGDDTPDIDGSEVAAMWRDDPAIVIKHNALDVVRTRAIYVKMAAALGWT